MIDIDKSMPFLLNNLTKKMPLIEPIALLRNFLNLTATENNRISISFIRLTHIFNRLRTKSNPTIIACHFILV